MLESPKRNFPGNPDANSFGVHVGAISLYPLHLGDFFQLLRLDFDSKGFTGTFGIGGTLGIGYGGIGVTGTFG